MGETVKMKEKMTGALPGFIISIVIGFAFYFGLKALSGNNAVFDYNNMISGILDSVPKQIAWFFMNFTEAQFYGNEVASAFLLAGAVIGAIVCGNHGAYGSGAVPAIILSQFVGAATGVFLYAGKFDNGGWYATYVPVVSVGPACVLMYGANIPVAVFAGVLGGIIGGPIAQFFSEKLPEGVHGTVANVTSMTISTITVSVVISALPWF